ncbi:MAG: CehA/McbA family metallohydrolase [Armatimonadetes bacterium]|nr:CehA/McbA family metallohydrolase [Armatimonadota bacterium]
MANVKEMNLPGSTRRRTYRGCVHVHSTFSDGSGSIPEIAEAANDASLDFVILNDHNTLRALEDGWEGRREGVLLLVGAELSTTAGHYLAFDLPPGFRCDRTGPQETIDRVNASGGFGILAHPTAQETWKDWSVSGYAGVEISNLVSLFDTAGRKNAAGVLLDFARTGFRECGNGIRRVMSRGSGESRALWAGLLAEGKCVGLGGTDVHANLRLGPFRLHIPSYREALRSLQVHVQSPDEMAGDLERDKRLVYGALREGRCFTVYSAWADPEGFDFAAESGGMEAAMGESVSLNGGVVTLSAEAPAGAPAEIRFLRDRALVHSHEGNSASFEVREAGAYRAEVWLRVGKGLVPWIVGNPIYVG